MRQWRQVKRTTTVKAVTMKTAVIFTFLVIWLACVAACEVEGKYNIRFIDSVLTRNTALKWKSCQSIPFLKVLRFFYSSPCYMAGTAMCHVCGKISAWENWNQSFINNVLNHTVNHKRYKGAKSTCPVFYFLKKWARYIKNFFPCSLVHVTGKLKSITFL